LATKFGLNTVIDENNDYREWRKINNLKYYIRTTQLRKSVNIIEPTTMNRSLPFSGEQSNIFHGDMDSRRNFRKYTWRQWWLFVHLFRYNIKSVEIHQRTTDRFEYVDKRLSWQSWTISHGGREGLPVCIFRLKK